MRLISVVVSILLVGMASADRPVPVNAQLCPIPPTIERADGLPMLPSGRAEGDTCITGNNGAVTYRWSTGLGAGAGIAVVDNMADLDVCCGTPGVLPLNVVVCCIWQGGGGERAILAHAELRNAQPGSGAPPDTCVVKPSSIICGGLSYRIAFPDPGGTGYYYAWVDFPLDDGCTYLPRTGYYFNVLMCDSGGGDVFRALDNVARGCFDWYTTDAGTTWPELAFGSPASLLLYSEFECTEQVPIEMSSLSAVAAPGVVQVRWRTESELENLGFNVYRAADGARTKVNEWLIPGAGTTLSPNDYQFADRDVAVGTRFQYWVSDVTFGGAETFHGPVVVVVPQENPSELGLTVEGSGGVLTLNMALPSEGQARLAVYNMAGHEVGVLVNQVLPAGRGQVEWDGTTSGGAAAPGAYVVRLVHDSGVVSAKAVLR